MLHLSQYLSEIRTQYVGDIKQIWCFIRKKWLTLTPEEIVRQTIILHLLDLNYPKGWISIERKIKNHLVNKRYDIVVLNRSGKPHILIECKALGEPIRQTTLDQITSYNYTLASPILWMSNGHENLIYHLSSQGEIKVLQSLPKHQRGSYLEEE